MKSRKTCISVLIAISLLLAAWIPSGAGYAAELEITSKAWILVDVDSGKTLAAFHENEQRPPASMTKLMTLLLAVEDLEAERVAPTDIVTASEKAWSMGGSQIYLEIGEQMTLHDMLLAVAVESANDASVAVAEHLAGGSLPDFIARMNAKAKELGMSSTHYVNCNGLPDEGHVSTASDMAKLALEAVKHPRLLAYTSVQEASLRGGTKMIYNTNKLLWRYEGVDGLKTGWTTAAGNCLTATALQDGLRLITVVMGGEKAQSQFDDSEVLLDYGFANYAYKSFFLKDTICASLQVGKGAVDVIDLAAAEDVGLSYEKQQGETNLSYSITAPSYVEAPVKKGQKLGEISIFSGGECKKTIDLTAAQSVERGGFFRQLTKMFRAVFLL